MQKNEKSSEVIESLRKGGFESSRHVSDFVARRDDF